MNEEFLLTMILKNQGLMLEILASLVQNKSDRREIYNYGKSIVEEAVHSLESLGKNLNDTDARSEK